MWVLAVLLLKAPLFQAAFLWMNSGLLALATATEDGTRFVFGYLGGGPTPFEITDPGANFILAFRALPLVLVISAISALLYYWRVLPLIVGGFAWLIRPYLERMNRGELFSVMACGMATIAGTMMVLYASVLGSIIPNVVGPILTASIISAPAALLVAALMVPSETRLDELKVAI